MPAPMSTVTHTVVPAIMNSTGQDKVTYFTRDYIYFPFLFVALAAHYLLWARAWSRAG